VRNSICCWSTDGRGFLRVKEILVRGTRYTSGRFSESTLRDLSGPGYLGKNWKMRVRI